MLHKWENNHVLRVRKAKQQFLVFVSLTVIGGSLPLITNIGTSRAATTSATTLSATGEGNSVPSSSDSSLATTNTTYEPTQVTIPSATAPTSSPSHQLSIEAVSSKPNTIQAILQVTRPQNLWNQSKTKKISTVNPGSYHVKINSAGQTTDRHSLVYLTISKGSRHESGWLSVRALPNNIRKLLKNTPESDSQLSKVGQAFDELLQNDLKTNNATNSQSDSAISTAAKKMLASFKLYYQKPTESNYQALEDHYDSLLGNQLSQEDLKNNVQTIGYHADLSGDPQVVAQRLFNAFLSQKKAISSSSTGKITKSGSDFQLINGRVVGQTILESQNQSQEAPKTVTVQTPVKTVTVNQPVVQSTSSSTSTSQSAGPSSGQPGDKWAAIDSKVTQLLQGQHISGRVAIVKNGQSHSINVGNATSAVKNANENVVFPLASLQKVITGAIFTQLVNETHSKLNQKEMLSDYFPKIPNADKITMRDLLDHVSGIDMDELTPTNVLSEDDAIQYTISNKNENECHT